MVAGSNINCLVYERSIAGCKFCNSALLQSNRNRVARDVTKQKTDGYSKT